MIMEPTRFENMLLCLLQDQMRAYPEHCDTEENRAFFVLEEFDRFVAVYEPQYIYNVKRKGFPLSFIFRESQVRIEINISRDGV